MNSDLAARVRGLLADPPGISERKMFGGIAFMLHGNMLVDALNSGQLAVRHAPDQREAALALPGATTLMMGEREMTGFVGVDPEHLATDAAIAKWIAYAETYVRTLPPK